MAVVVVYGNRTSFYGTVYKEQAATVTGFFWRVPGHARVLYNARDLHMEADFDSNPSEDNIRDWLTLSDLDRLTLLILRKSLEEERNVTPDSAD